MQMFGHLLLILAVSFVSAMVSSCTFSGLNKDTYSGLTPSSRPVTVDPPEQDEQSGSLASRQHPFILATYGGEYRDIKLERMVAKIVGKLAEFSGNQDENYHVTILNSPSINAFALPGGYVYVTRGLLALANDSAEVAAVIAHEMAHITANHGILRQEKQEQMEIASTVVGQILGDRLGEGEVQLRSRLSLAQFSRNQELQADQIGITTMAEAGYDPFAASRFLLRMEAYSGFRSISGATNSSLDFLATHPATPQRVKLATSMARKVSAPGIGTIDRNSFLGGVDGMLYGDNEDDGYIRGRRFIHPRLGIIFRVPEGFLLDNSKAAVIANGPDHLAIRFDSVVVVKQTPLDYIRSGWVKGIESGSIRSFEVNGIAAASARAQSEKWQFSIVVLMVKDRAYRFLIAAPKKNIATMAKEELSFVSMSLDALSREVANSFRMLSQAETMRLKPLRLRVVTVGAGDSVAKMAAYMRDIDNSESLFRLINGLTPTAQLTPGMNVKIISE